MRAPSHAAGTFAMMIAGCAALGLAVQSCGVMSSTTDCAERAICPEAGGADSMDQGDLGPGGNPEAGGDDGADATSESNGFGDGPPSGEATSEASGRGADAADVAVPDVVSEAPRDVSSEADAVSEAAPPPDVCVPTGLENCQNGIDDNCDGRIDCADPQCAGYACAAPVPAGWTGPSLFWSGAAASTPPACPAGFQTMDAHSGPTGTADGCSCACSPSGQSCSAQGAFHPDQTCAVAICASATPTSDGACVTVPGNPCGTGGSFTIGNGAIPAPTGGSCAPQVTTTNGSAMGWQMAIRVCSRPGSVDSPGGCPVASDQCVGPTTGFGTTPCVYQSGTPACPAGYPNNHVIYSGEVDTRACGACTCSGAPSGGSCAGTVSIYGTTAGGCNGAPGATYTLGQVCQSYNGVSNGPGFVKANYTVGGGMCSVVAQPQPTGGVTATGPTTVCCM